MKILPINFNIKNNTTSFKSTKINNIHTLITENKIDPKKEQEAAELISQSERVLASSNSIKKIAKRKYAEAQDIYFTWQQKSPVTKENSTIEYITGFGGKLDKFIEKRADGTERTIKYSDNGTIDITETDFNGKQYIYIFNKGQLRRCIQGKHTEKTRYETSCVVPREYIFSDSGDLMIYRENNRCINAFNKSKELLGNFSTIEKVFNFATQDDKTYLKSAKTGVCIPSNSKQYFEAEYLFDEFGNLVK